MNEIVSTGTTALVAREVRRGVRAVKGEAAIRATTVQATTFVTSVAIQDAAFVGALEEAAIKQAPLAEERVRLLADGHAGACLAQVIKPW